MALLPAALGQREGIDLRPDGTLWSCVTEGKLPNAQAPTPDLPTIAVLRTADPRVRAMAIRSNAGA
jgi:hypothetical protein